MGETNDGQPAAGSRLPEDEEPESPGRSSFFSRLFRRDWGDGEPPEAAPAAGAPEADAGAPDLAINLRNMRRLRVDDVSVPRPDIVAVPADIALDTLVEVFRSSTLSRLPVYSEALDQPLGQLHLKDLALRHGFGASAEFDLPALLRPLLYAAPSMPIGVLLQKMQAARIHMALVIDEYGGVDGLVTIEDLLEQIVGDIDDEHDEAESLRWTREAPGIYTALGRVELDAFEAEIGARLAEPWLAEEVDTLGGLVFRLSGRVPAPGEVVMHPDGHAFEVLDADARKIKRLRVRLCGEAPNGSAKAAE